MTTLFVTAMLLASARPQPGQQAPSFSLPSSDGKPVSLSDFRGRSIVLAFFPKAFTAG